MGWGIYDPDSGVKKATDPGSGPATLAPNVQRDGTKLGSAQSDEALSETLHDFKARWAELSATSPSMRNETVAVHSPVGHSTDQAYKILFLVSERREHRER